MWLFCGLHCRNDTIQQTTEGIFDLIRSLHNLLMVQGLIQTLLVRLPLAYFMSIQPDASLTKIGLAAPASTAVGILQSKGRRMVRRATGAGFCRYSLGVRP